MVGGERGAMRWAVTCVYKSGGEYGPEHVLALRDMLARHLQNDYDFVCVTDCYIPGVERVLLTEGWEGWWSKLESFRLWRDVFECPMAHFDLDMVVLRDFELPVPEPNQVFMLRDFFNWNRRAELNSSIVLWDTDLGFIYDEAKERTIPSLKRQFYGDQNFTQNCLKKAGNIRMGYVDDVVSVVSYKAAQLAGKSVPKNAQIVCFHGQPRPWDVKDPWVVEAGKWQHMI